MNLSWFYEMQELEEMEREAYIEENGEEYIPSANNHDYSPSNPWDAPGMSIRDFI